VQLSHAALRKNAILILPAQEQIAAAVAGNCVSTYIQAVMTALAAA
jgi:hypothetical protein